MTARNQGIHRQFSRMHNAFNLLVNFNSLADGKLSHSLQHRCKKRFFTFFILATFFTFFYVF